MPGQVRVEDFEVFRVFRGALLKFAQAAEQSLTSADARIAAVHSWLESEQMTFWQTQLRKRMEAVTQARDEVRKKTLYKDATGRVPSAIEEQKHLARCIAAVAQAEEKIQAVRKSLPRLEKETEQYRGGVGRLNGDVSAEIPRAIALLDRLLGTLEEYVQIEAPSAEIAPTAEAATVDGSMSRGGDAGIPPPPANTPEPPSAGNPADPATQSKIENRKSKIQQEVRHVADGK